MTAGEGGTTTAKQPGPKTDGPWKRRMRGLLFWAIVLQLAGIALFVGAILLGEATRPTFIALYAPRQPLLVVAVLAALLAPLTRRHVKVLVVTQILVCLLLLFPVLGFSAGFSRRPSGDSEKVIRLATYNVFFGKMGRPQLMDELAAMPVDVLLIQAPHESMGARLRERFPDREVHQFEDFIIVSKLKVREVVKPKPLDDETSAMFCSYLVETKSGPLGIYNVHPFSPRHALFGEEPMDRNIRNREEQIAAAVNAAHADGPPFIIAGDTNLPGLSPLQRRHLSGLQDAFADVGFGFGYTFPAKRPWMRIDRVLGSEGIRFLGARVGPRGASDHRPLFVDFEIVKQRR